MHAYKLTDTGKWKKKKNRKGTVRIERNFRDREETTQQKTCDVKEEDKLLSGERSVREKGREKEREEEGGHK